MSNSVLKKIKVPARFSFLGYMGDVQGCGTIRVIIPYMLLNHFRSHNNQVMCMTTYMHNYVPDLNFYRNFTFVQFQRSATKEHVDIFNHFKGTIQKKYNIPMIYEIDDLLIDIPEWNYASTYYNNNKEYVEQLISMSDAVMVSTNKLKEIYGKYNKNIHVQPNRLAKFIWGDIFPAHLYKDTTKKVRILWGGSQNHFHNPAVTKGVVGGDFSNKLMDFIKKTTDIYDWYFVGAMPHELENIKSKVHFVPWVDVLHYPKVIKDIEPDIGIAPLVDNVFNACKSNLKQLEYVACGCAGVFSNVEPYKNCYLKVKSDEEMIEWIEKLASDINLRGTVWTRDRERVGSQLYWEDGNNVRNYVDKYLKAFGQRLP
jgi:hypothetical protein